MGISLDPSWNPRDEWDNWKELSCFEDFFNDALRPNGSTDPTWTEDVLSATLNTKSEAREALWQSVLAIWGLKKLRERSVQDKWWVRHMVAWMVRCDWLNAVCRLTKFTQGRHHELCQEARAPPAPPVLVFVRYLYTSGTLIKEEIPEFEGFSLPAKPELGSATDMEEVGDSEEDEDGDGDVEKLLGAAGEIREDEGKASNKVDTGPAEVMQKKTRPVPKNKTAVPGVVLPEDNDVEMAVERTVVARKRKKSGVEEAPAEGRDTDGEAVRKKTKTRGRKTASAAVDEDTMVVEETSSSDEEFATPMKAKIGPPLRKAKEVGKVITRSGRGGNTGGKRVGVEKFDGVEVLRKPPEQTKGKKDTAIDLSGRLFNENTDLDPDLVPLVRGEVCGSLLPCAVSLTGSHRHATTVGPGR